MCDRLKCNRKVPCDNCAKRNEEPDCRYATTYLMKSADTGLDLHGRIHYLEDRIKQLENYIGGPASSASRFEDVSPDDEMRMQGTHISSPANGLLFSGPGGTRYINSTHWQTIMNAVSAIPPSLLPSLFLISDHYKSINRPEHSRKAALPQTVEAILMSLHEYLEDPFY